MFSIAHVSAVDVHTKFNSISPKMTFLKQRRLKQCHSRKNSLGRSSKVSGKISREGLKRGGAKVEEKQRS